MRHGTPFRLVTMLSGLIAAATLIGCSSGGSGGSGGATASAGSSPSGSPVKLMIIAPTGTAAVNYPDAVGATRAAVRAINARGGLKGHPVELLYCNAKNDVPTAQACAQKAVDSHVLAVVSEFSVGGGVIPTLEKAGIPAVGSSGLAVDSSDLTSRVSFVIQPLILYPAVCPSLLKKVGVAHPAIVGYDLSASDRLVKLAEVGAKAVGLTAKPVVRLPITTSDWTPAGSQLKAGGADGATLVVTEQAAFALAKDNPSTKFCHSTAVISHDDMIKLGARGDNIVEASAFPEFSQAAQFSELRRMNAEMDADYSAGDADAAPALRTSTSTINAWLSVQIVDKIAGAVSGDLTPSSLLAQLNTTKNLDLQLIPPLDFTKPSPIPGTERLFNTSMRGIRWDSAKKQFVPLGGEVYPALTILEQGAH